MEIVIIGVFLICTIFYTMNGSKPFMKEMQKHRWEKKELAMELEQTYLYFQRQYGGFCCYIIGIFLFLYLYSILPWGGVIGTVLQLIWLQWDSYQLLKTIKKTNQYIEQEKTVVHKLDGLKSNISSCISLEKEIQVEMNESKLSLLHYLLQGLKLMQFFTISLLGLYFYLM